MNTLTVAVAQPLVVPGDVPENVRRLTPLVAEAAQRGARLVLFSECGLTGYDLDNVGLNAALSADDIQLDGLARAHDIVIVAGFYERGADNIIYNSALAIYPDGRRVLQRKHNIIAHEAANTPVQAAPRRREIFTVDGLRMAILICADGGLPGIWEELARDQHVDAVLLPTAGLGRAAGWALREADLRQAQQRASYIERMASVCFSKDAFTRTLELNISMITCNQAGWVEATGYFQPGHSMIVDRTGDLAALIPGCAVVEHLRPRLAIGTIHQRD